MECNRVKYCNKCNIHYRGVQLPEGGPTVQTGVLVLPNPDLHPVLHVSHRLVGVLLVGPKRSARASIARCDNPPDHGHPDLGY